MFEFLEAIEHAKEGEVHRSHIERSDLGLVGRRRAHSFVHGHGRRTAGSEVDDAIRALLDDLEKRREGFRALVGLTGFRVAGMQMHDRSTCFRRLDRGVGDLLRRHGKRLRHRGRVDRAGHGAGDDDFMGGHGCCLFVAEWDQGLSACLILWAASAARRSLRRSVSAAMRSASGRCGHAAITASTFGLSYTAGPAAAAASSL